MRESPNHMRARSRSGDDPISGILRVANAQSAVTGAFTAGGPWAICFPAPGKIKFFGVVRGACWLRLDGAAAPVRLAAGDVFLLSAQRSFVLAGDLAVAPIDSARVFTPRARAMWAVGKGEDCFVIGGHVRLDEEAGSILVDILPPLIHVRAPRRRSPRRCTGCS